MLALPSLTKGSVAYNTNEEWVEELAKVVAGLDVKIQELSGKLRNSQQIQVPKEEFLNLIKLASHKMKAANSVEKDAYCRILFLNLRVDNEKVASYHWREPFASLVRATAIKPGRVGAINLEQVDTILTSLKRHWDIHKPENIKMTKFSDYVAMYEL